MTRNIVFVVGAGASCELGMPAGNTLKNRVEELLTFEFPRQGFQTRGSREISAELQRMYNDKIIDDDGFQRHYEAASITADGLHLAASTDNFLNAHEDNKELVLMGKMAIVESILEAEKRALEPIWNAQRARIETRKLDKTWYPKLFTILVQNKPRDKIKEVFQGVTFIIFNYDRAVELIFPYLLKDYYAVPLDVAVEAFASAKVVHPYGKIGNLQDPKTQLTMGFGMASKNLSELAQEINTFTEGEQDVDLGKDIDKAIAGATTIVFLGYGFIEMNNSILNRSEVKVVESILATTMGLSKSDTASVRAKLSSEFKTVGSTMTGPSGSKILNFRQVHPDSIHTSDTTCSKFFEEFRLTI